MFKVVALSAAAFVGLAQALTVNTPAALVQCQPALLSWSDGTAPYYLAIIPGGQPSAAALENLPTQTGNSYTWTVDQASGQSVTLKITDSTGAVNYSDKVTIQAGTSTTCGAGSGGSGSGSGTAPSASNQAVTAINGGSSASPAASRTALPTSNASLATSTSSGLIKTTSSSAAASGIPAAAAGSSTTASAPASSTSTHNGAASIKAASGLLIGGLVLALVA